MPDVILQSRRVVTPAGVRPAAVVIRNGIIKELTAPFPRTRGARVLDFGTDVVMAGLVDTHVHINEPGRTDWEGFRTATRAAAAGGITTLIDMPLNCIPVTTTVPAFKTKLAAVAGKLWVDCGFWGGVVPGNAGQLSAMIDRGVAGFKAFLIHSGIDDFPNAGEADLNRAMPILARRGAPLLVHAELCSHAQADGRGNASDYGHYLDSRPDRWEVDAIRLMIRLCRKHRCRVHIVHLSSAKALELLRAARREGLPITAETCPHYLFFSSSQIPSRHTEFKCAPPIRSEANRTRLWNGLKSGAIDFVVSDHSPCTPALKALKLGDFMKAWGGISSVQFSLPAVWTQARRRGFSLEDIGRWMSQSPARFAGLAHKGRLAPGFDADLAVWNPEASFTPKPSKIFHKHKLTPYSGKKLFGVVQATYLRGKRVYHRGTFSGPFGKPILGAS